MIIRSYFRCTTCGQVHMVRIGMGQEIHQTHRFACLGCSEDMVIALNVDYKKVGCCTEAIENAEHADETPDVPTVNVDACFPVPASMRNNEHSFPRLERMREVYRAAQKAGSIISKADIPVGMEEQRPFRRPDIAAEWKLLKKAWSLHRNGREKLSQRQINEASQAYYEHEPLKNLPDWLWRFTLFLGQPVYEETFRALIKEIDSLKGPEFDKLMHFYEEELRTERSERYFNIMRDFFSSFSEFSQVYFLVSKGIEIPSDDTASSTDFNSIKMFYGNAFECFASSVDILAYANNIKNGRSFDTFEKLTIKSYNSLDKANRFGPFINNQAFNNICTERDNQLRNASHHGALRFDSSDHAVKYREGKGLDGPEISINYVQYLARCTKLFLQAMCLFRTEILLCEVTRKRFPL